ncbi:MAG: hypothetical protein ACRCT8_16840 [Lacipirellulaceae bacterium]
MIWTRSFAAWIVVVATAGQASAQGILPPPINLPFDALYTVGANGSTDPVTTFEVGGPAPWLYLDLPDGAVSSFSAWAYSDWFVVGSSAPRFRSSNGVYTDFQIGAAGSDKYWMAPTEARWQASGAVGEWRVSASHALVELILIYGVGVGNTWATGAGTVNFNVVQSVPEPSGIALALATVALAVGRRLRR